MMNINMQRLNVVSDILVYLGIALIAIFFYKCGNAIEGLGGSIILVPVISIIILLTFVIKPLASHFNYATMTLIGILALNYFGYLEMDKIKVDFNIGMLYVGCVMLTLIFFIKSIMSLVKPFNIFEDFYKEPKSKLFVILFASVFTSIVFIFLIMLSAQYSLFRDYSKLFNYSNLNGAFIIAGLLISLIYLLKVRDSEIMEILIDEKDQFGKYSLNRFKRYVQFALLFVVSIGSFIEITRGLWLLWIETIFIVSLMLIMLWKFYRNIFEKQE